ncbi:tripartite tricarboxylate transporter substrate binding protein [Alcaligenaceae bacterium]|nr:tripartite tricarboxylate transporter substrate binding protein [Alcaligenaceae bacterium]
MNQLLIKGLAGLVCSVSATTASYATDFPVQPIRLMVGYSPGGSVDIVARAFAQKLGTLLKQSVVVENRGGASGTIAAQAVVKAAPDGYTLYFVASPTVTITPAITKTPFDPAKDFSPIGTVVDYTNVLLVNSESPYKTVADLIAQAKANPGSITYGSAGVGASNHLSGELLADKANVKLTHVPYKGNAPALTDLMAGRISVVFDLNTTARNQVNGGKVRALAVTSAVRNPMFPDVPTMMESGYKDFEFTGWLGLLGPAGTPAPVVQKLALATQSIAQDKDFMEQMAASGYVMSSGTPAQLSARMKREGDMFRDLAERANLRQE